MRNTTIYIIALVFILALISLVSLTTTSPLSTTQIPSSPSTTGPEPPATFSPTLPSLSVTAQILNVPEYSWRHGCAPTASGMILGYYDTNYGTNLLGYNKPEAIASTQHYNSFSLPMDSQTENILKDKSELGGAHIHNSIADFQKTSFSIKNLRYGWTYVSDLQQGLREYAAMRGYDLRVQYYNQFTLSSLKNEIDSGRPFIVFMNAEGTGNADHFAVCSGYDNNDLIIKTTWSQMPQITVPILPESQQYGIAGVFLTTNPSSGEGSPALQTPGFTTILIILSFIALIGYGRRRRPFQTGGLGGS